PKAFWYFSIGGGITILCYAIHRADPVFIVGQACGLIVYLRNIYFLSRDPGPA
ncbi:MAG: lipid-A-disaccharide synthase N-terminal domain-containing protein, partial [Gammaproteobacteria bacterium]